MSDTYVGEIRRFGGAFAPPGWLLCDGRMLNAEDHADLFDVIGTRFGGGDGQFALPDLNQATDGVAFIIAAAGRTPVRQIQTGVTA